MEPSLSLLEKYNIPVPRYTSYPTVPVWKDSIDAEIWEHAFRHQFLQHNRKEGISLYLHLPFCESLCTYCGCNKKITTNHQVENEYLNAIIREWKLYLDIAGEMPVIREIHLGGGTPTFFSPSNLARLMDALFDGSIMHAKHEFSIEGHPNNTSKAHLQTLYNLGFRRISYGVQDHDPEVQKIINRIQPFDRVKQATDDARHAGFESVNFDLIYGLPRQTLATMEKTIEQSISLKPDRVAFYSYAHVPWTSRGQRLFDENDLPGAEEKMKLYRLGKSLFARAGYTDIGMDHFSLSHDALYKAWENGSLHRNFMGYTTQQTQVLLGLGVSSISDAGIAFAQNNKTLHDYYASVANHELPVQKGYFLNAEDLAFRKYILDISCKGNTQFRKEDYNLLSGYTFPELRNLEDDGLVTWNETEMQVTVQGRNFIRNICRAFDLHLLRGQNSGKLVFSKAV